MTAYEQRLNQTEEYPWAVQWWSESTALESRWVVWDRARTLPGLKQYVLHPSLAGDRVRILFRTEIVWVGR